MRSRVVRSRYRMGKTGKHIVLSNLHIFVVDELLIAGVRMLYDVEFFKSRLAKIEGAEAVGNVLIAIVQAKGISQIKDTSTAPSVDTEDKNAASDK